MKAIWKSTVIADSDDTIVIEGNHYFPAESINQEHFTDSSTTTICPWKGTANYYNVLVEGEENSDAAWYYADPKYAAQQIKNYVAFWKGVEVTE